MIVDDRAIIPLCKAYPNQPVAADVKRSDGCSLLPACSIVPISGDFLAHLEDDSSAVCE